MTVMTTVFIMAAIYCSVAGLLICFFPESFIKFNDWLTEKTLRHETAGTFWRIVIGLFFLGIGIIFWWVIFS
jgi:hypothetical protein